MTRICVFGDSIAYGAWDLDGGWVQRLKRFLSEKTLSEPESWFIIYNLGISGDTTEEVLERIEPELNSRIREDEETIIIFAIGINDSQYIHDKNSVRVSPEKFKINLQSLINLAQKFTSKIIFVGLTPVNESKVDPIPWDANISYRNEYIQRYNDIIDSICKENRIHFIEIFDQWKNLNYNLLLEDGLHPNSKGHQKIFKTVRDFLIENKII